MPFSLFDYENIIEPMGATSPAIVGGVKYYPASTPVRPPTSVRPAPAPMPVFDSSMINMFDGDNRNFGFGDDMRVAPPAGGGGGCPAGYSRPSNPILGYQGSNPYTDIRPEFELKANPRGLTFDV